jgi:lipoic acid synthetase
VLDAGPDLLNHNIETVRRLFPSVRPQGKYERSMVLLRRAAGLGAQTKSGLMVGLGEQPEEVIDVMRDLREAGCRVVTIGQYLQPTRDHMAVSRFYHPDEFAAFKIAALEMGFHHVEAGPLVRSSYHAEAQAVSASDRAASQTSSPAVD